MLSLIIIIIIIFFYRRGTADAQSQRISHHNDRTPSARSRRDIVINRVEVVHAVGGGFASLKSSSTVHVNAVTQVVADVVE